MAGEPLPKSRLALYAALALACGAVGAAIGRQVYLKPIQAINEKRYVSHQALMRLYDLQLAHKRAHGVYANDLDALLAGAPDAAEIRAKLKATVDVNTLAVVGDANRFRLEANILDKERTAVKFRGPAGR